MTDMPFQKITIPVTRPKFGMDSEVQHQKGGLYTIVGLPTEIIIEETGEPAYAYQGSDGRVWIRSQTKMEDGRFRLSASSQQKYVRDRQRKKVANALLVGMFLMALCIIYAHR